RMPVVKINHTFRKALKKLASENIDCGIVQTQIYTNSAVGARFFAKHNIPAIVINHGTNHMVIGNALTSFAGRVYEHLNTAAIKHYCKNFYGVSQSCNQWLAHFGVTATDTLYNSVDPQQLEQLAYAPACSFRQAYGLTQKDKIICFTGRLVAEKGPQKLVQAYTLLPEALRADTYLFIAGDGALMPQLQPHATSHIILLGSLPFAKIVPLLCESDIFCLPTDYPEGLPTSVLEAVACKCFVITTTRGGSKELITGRDYGIILQENTPSAISLALAEALSQPKACKAAADKSYSRLLEAFTWEATCTKLEQIDWRALR
ncbi:MAG: glycosyltransferase family 4 protein, partial [Oscillospiraceae bacterium]|nr:glycosyltransferase family 4 protein [Oscillospiraceae bacterium]